MYTDSSLRSRALSVFRKAADQRFSYVDCLSFALMRARGIGEAFAFDEDFVRYGFVVRPREP